MTERDDLSSGNDDAARIRVAPSTNPDGLDLTPEEFHAMSREECRSVFGVAGLEEVPLVGPGHLARASRECLWYVRFRPAPENPGPKDRKQDSYELVVKRPKGKDGATADGNPDRFGLTAKVADRAKLEALIFLAREAGRRRRAATWPIERIQSLRCFDVIDVWMSKCLVAPAQNDTKTARATRTTYRSELRAFQRAFPEKEIGDVNDSIVQEYFDRNPNRKPTTLPGDLHTAKRALKEGLLLLGVPPNYNLDFKIPAARRLPKVAWTSEEYDRLCAAAGGWLFNPDGSPTMIPGPDGLVQERRAARSIADREAWRRAIEFLPYTGSRNGRLPPTRWVPPHVDPADGKPLDDRPWIEVTETVIIYHRDGETNDDDHTTKRRGPQVIPDEFASTVRRWFEDDLDAGIEFVFHKADGSRYNGEHLDRLTFKRILADAGVDESRVPHHFKDLCVEWADQAGVDRETLAVHIDTTPKTIAAKYGEPKRLAKMIEAAEGLSQKAWRERGDRTADVLRRLQAGRLRARSAGPVGVVHAVRPAEASAPSPKGRSGRRIA